MKEFKNIGIWLASGVVTVALALQYNSIRQVRSELAELRSNLGKEADLPASPAATAAREFAVRSDASAHQRLAELERALAELTRATEHLKARGQLPLVARDIEEARARFLNPALPDRDRLRALELLRRNGPLTDDLAFSAIDWAQTSTNAAMRRSLLQQLDGATNAILKEPLLRLAGTEQNSNVREQVAENLRSFIADPQVEASLWSLLRNDPDGDVRDEAAQALSRGPFTESRIAALKDHALDAQSPLDERLLALRALDRANVDSGAATAMLADLAQTTTDPDERLKLFRAFDGSDDPVVKLPLVHGLQDANPLVREEAVDALSDFRDDPAVLQWLQYVAQNDADPQVRREAYQALAND